MKNQMLHKTIRFDWSSLRSVTAATRRKSMLENQGFKLHKTTQLGTDKWKLDYKKVTK